MTIGDQIQNLGTHSVLRVSGSVPLEVAMKMAISAIAWCRENNVQKLLVNGLEMHELPVPTVSQRYWFVADSASAAKAAVKVAMVLRPELIDPQRFGMTVAANRNLNANVFTDEAQATAWLLAP